MIELPGYTVPGELTFTWVPGYYVPEAVAVDEGGQTLSPERPPPNPVPASAATPVVNSVALEQFIPTMPSTPEDMRQVTSTESVRQTDRANVNFRCVRGQTRTRAVTTGPEQHAGMSIPHDII